MTALYFGRLIVRTSGRFIAPTGLLALAMALVGCGTTLEDGYKPRALGSSPEVRKSYYASPFTDQAEAGNHEAPPSSPHGGGPR